MVRLKRIPRLITNPTTNTHIHTTMTYAEHQEFAQIERTCDEIRKDNIELRYEIQSLHKDLCHILTLNTLGITRQIADLCNAIISQGTR